MLSAELKLPPIRTKLGHYQNSTAKLALLALTSGWEFVDSNPGSGSVNKNSKWGGKLITLSSLG